ncbi:GNAT family N-acetyltransferase [Acidicapsa dinghuensis]|uniref:GNAT family N-acetyltransferase n=1 Tax=Acidicapsa dinghuensis TaxID=2218256 RepID=A0ABW1EJD0_9BACT|nr:GNAT family N-acetyltransferase [Acidicapsa dinghuensis]
MIETRLFVAEDFKAVCAIEEQCFAPPVRFSKRLICELTTSELCRTWIGVADGIVCGFAIVALMDEDDADAAYVWTIEVLPEYRGLGVARKLMERVEESARRAEKLRIALHVEETNTAGIALYERCGYRSVATAKHFYGRNQHGFRYEKAIAE